MEGFTIDDYDFRDTIRIERKLLTLTGFYPKRDKTLFTPIQTLIKFFCLFLTYTQFATMILYIIVHQHDLLKLTETLETLMTQLAFITKLICFSINEQKLLALEDSLVQPRFYGYPRERLEVFKGKMRSCESLVKIFRFCCFGTILFFGIFPYMDSKRVLPMPGWFPYDVDKFYHLTTAFQISTLAVSAYNNGTIDCLMWMLTTVAAGQFEVLKENLKNIRYSHKNSMDEELIACIKHHKKIVVEHLNSRQISPNTTLLTTLFSVPGLVAYAFSLAKSIEDMFAMGIFVQFFSSIIIICTTGFQMTVIPIFSARFVYILFYFGAMMCQIGMYCWFGHDVMTTTNEIGKLFYLSNWYESEVKIRKIMLIFLERTKKPITFTAGKIVALSLVTLLTILRSSYSYFAVMQRLYRK